MLTINPKVTVFVLTRDRVADLKKCLEGVKSQSYQNFELLVIDNSPTRSAQALCGQMKVDRYIPSNATRLPILFNLGWKKARTEIIGYLADDTIPTKHWLENIIKVFAEAPKDTAVATGPVVASIWPAGEMHRLYLSSRRNIFLRMLAWPYIYFVMENNPAAPGKLYDSGAYSFGAGLKEIKDQPRQEIDLATTTNMGVKRSALKKINGFDRKFHFNHADGDVFIRLKRAGFKIIFDPKIAISHHIRLGPSRSPYFIGKDTAYYLKKDIKPKTVRGWFGKRLNIFVLNSYWLYATVKHRSFKQLAGISGFYKGAFTK